MINDLLAPGQHFANAVAVRFSAQSTSHPINLDTNPGPTHKQLQSLKALVRRQQIEVAELKTQLQTDSQIGRFPFVTQSNASLVVPELLTANILSHHGSDGLAESIVIDKGTFQQIQHESFVLESTNPIIDQGADQSLKTGQPVYAGRCVVGRIQETGRWTSALQLTTNPEYSGRARLARKTSEGLTFGAEGILEGIGNGLCRLTGIPDTQPVAVGDEVYTGGQSVMLRDPMFYGQIVKADLLPGSAWDIVVKPPLETQSLTQVVVLRAMVNPIRILGQ